MKIVIVIFAFVLGVMWISWGIYDLIYSGDPKRSVYITDQVAEYAMTLNSGQVTEVNTWYFNKAHHYISEFSVSGATKSNPIHFKCSWPAKQNDVNLDEICTKVR